jgi:hypothetical protein
VEGLVDVKDAKRREGRGIGFEGIDAFVAFEAFN